MTEIIRARAPLRLGLAGGGTDVSPFPEIHGGYVLNATIDRFAYASISPRTDGKVMFRASDLDAAELLPARPDLPVDTGLKIHRGVYNRMVRDFNGGVAPSLTLTTSVNSPIGSGLGSSSALVVAIVEAFARLFRAPLGEYDVARLAYDIERHDLNFAGGSQDQYAATFGGFNFMEFGPGDRVVVNPLRVRSTTIYELEASLVLFFTGVSRESAQIIETQSKSVGGGGSPLDAMHALKATAVAMKEALLFGDIKQIAEIMTESWLAKKRTSDAISNPAIDRIFQTALSHGAMAGKISGAGGGGFMMFVCEPDRRDDLIRALAAEPSGVTSTCRFTDHGVITWQAR